MKIEVTCRWCQESETIEIDSRGHPVDQTRDNNWYQEAGGAYVHSDCLNEDCNQIAYAR